MIQRNPNGRQSLEIRPLILEAGVNRYAEGSVLVKAGNTHVLCTASVEESVPQWLKGQKQGQKLGWVSAEYSMLPRSTHTRSKRDREKVSGRTQEIQRLIGRALRACIHLDRLGERSILIDCDVLQADGGTRTASITGGCVALGLALKKLSLWPSAWKETVSAVSVGMKNGEVLVDLDYAEDSTCDVDMNFVMTGSGLFIEVQGTAEHQAFSKNDLDRMTNAASSALKQIKEIQMKLLD